MSNVKVTKKTFHSDSDSLLHWKEGLEKNETRD